MATQLIIGLGNPGREYEETRHNAGFFFVDALAQDLGISFSPQSKFFGEFAKGSVKGQDIFLLKPTTFMNRSGMAVAAIANFYKLSPQAILAVHDELDLPPGDAKLKVGGGAGGHNGLKDMIKALGTQEFTRLRLGIGHPGDRHQVSNYVLHAFSKTERIALDDAITRALHVMPEVLADQLPLAMNKLHTKG
jgi:PTH1 family peptidyl-tRNA hydrolase